jgi:hypothetical protein
VAFNSKGSFMAVSSMLAAYLAIHANSIVHGDICIIEDGYSSDTGLWLLANSYPSDLTMTRTGGRLSVAAPSTHNSIDPARSYAMSSGWEIDMTQDWIMSSQLRCSPPTPYDGQLGAFFTIVFEADYANFDPIDSWVYQAAQYRDSANEFDFEGVGYWINGVSYLGDYDYDYSYEDTLYVWYHASSKMIYACSELHNYQNAFATYLGNISSKPSAVVVLGGNAHGYTPSFGAGSIWWDDFCLLDGQTVGPAVGACCVDGVCLQLPAAGCDGTFLGSGSECTSCGCDLGGCCPQDLNGDGHVNLPDLLIMFGQWAQSCTQCQADFDASGEIGIHDLLIALQHWGQCDSD